MAAINLSDLNLDSPQNIQLNQVTNFVVIRDSNYPALSTTVVDGYDSQGNALSSVQVFPRTAKLVCDVDNISDGPITLNKTLGQNFQLAQVTSYAPLQNDDSNFPALSTTVVEGFYAFGGAVEHVQINPRCIQFVKFGAGITYDVNQPLPIQLGQVGNYFPATAGLPTISTTVVNGYDSSVDGAPLSSTQVNYRNVALVQNLATINWQQTYAAPIQLSQVTNYVAINASDATYPALQTTVVNGYDSSVNGNPLSSTQIFNRTASLVHKVNGATIDTETKLPINMLQALSYVPLQNNDATYPALQTTVVNGYDSSVEGNPLSSTQVFPRMVQLVYVINT